MYLNPITRSKDRTLTIASQFIISLSESSGVTNLVTRCSNPFTTEAVRLSMHECMLTTGLFLRHEYSVSQSLSLRDRRAASPEEIPDTRRIVDDTLQMTLIEEKETYPLRIYGLTTRISR